MLQNSCKFYCGLQYSNAFRNWATLIASRANTSQPRYPSVHIHYEAQQNNLTSSWHHLKLVISTIVYCNHVACNAWPFCCHVHLFTPFFYTLSFQQIWETMLLKKSRRKWAMEWRSCLHIIKWSSLSNWPIHDLIWVEMLQINVWWLIMYSIDHGVSLYIVLHQIDFSIYHIEMYQIKSRSTTTDGRFSEPLVSIFLDQ